MESKKQLFMESLLEIVNEYEDKNFEELNDLYEQLSIELLESEKKYFDIMEKVIKIQGILIFKALEEK